MIHIIIVVSWIIAVTSPMCTRVVSDSQMYYYAYCRNLNIFNCNNVNNDFVVKWNFENKCQPHLYWPYPNNGVNLCYIVNISNSNFIIINKRLTDLIKNCPSKIIEVNIYHSHIQTVDADAFSEITSIKKLNFNFNEIDNIDFLNNLLGLTQIELNYNKISTINSKNFMKLKSSLQNLSIGFNNLLTIGSSTYQLNSLRELHLNNNNLTKIENNVLDGLPSLEILNLAYNYISILEPKLLKKLKNLKIIHLDGNQIKAISYFDVAYKNVNNMHWGGFDSTQNRQTFELYLQNNPLSFGINETYWNFNNELIKLDLSRCNVTVIKNFFGNLTSLEILKFTDSSIEEISPNAFNSLTMLKELDLRNNKLKTLHENTFTGLKNLTKLYLSRNPINVIFQSFSAFENLLILNISVQHFSITNNTFYGLKPVYEINFINSSIISIDSGSFSNIDLINTLRLENSTIKKLQPNVFKNLTFLHSSELNLNNNNLQCIVNDTFAGVTQLEKLFISNNKLIKIEVDAFRVLDHLKQLDLSKNNIQVLDNYTFSYLKALESLNVTHNKLTTLYSNSFYNLYRLEILDVSNNNVNEFPLGTFNNVPNLLTLNLEYNGISNFKTGSFSNLDQLTSLDLSNNNLMILNELILYPLHRLNYLDLASNKLSFINANSLLLHLPTLRFISINENNWNCQLLTGLLKTFKSNNVNYDYKRIKHYKTENVDGILCYENQNPTEESDITTLKTNGKENDIDLLRQYLELLINNTKTERSKNENFARTESQQLINSSKLLENVKIVNDDGTNIINIFILIVCLGIFLFQIFSLYKRYYIQTKNVAHHNDFSEIELLNTS